MREIWMMQPRFERRQANTAFSLIEQPRFRAGFDFLRLRADVGEAPAELADWWEDFSLGDDDEREALLAAVREATRGAPRRVPAPKRGEPRAAGDARAGAAEPSTADDAEAPEGEPSADEPGSSAPAARKRRRRRRKPSGSGASAGESGAPSSTPSS